MTAAALQRRRVLVALSGMALVVWGLVLDALIHRLDPVIGVTESLFSLRNPGHLVTALGVMVVVTALVRLAQAELAGHSRRSENGHRATTPVGARPGRSLIRAALLGLIAAATAMGAVALSAARAAPLGTWNTLAVLDSRRLAPDLHLIVLGQGDLVFTAYSAYAADGGPSIEQLEAIRDAYHQVQQAVAPFADDAEAARRAGYTVEAPAADQPATGELRLFSPVLVADGHVADFARPEGLIYGPQSGGRRQLRGVLFLAPPGLNGPQFGGPLTLWLKSVRPPLCTGADGIPMATTSGACLAGTTASEASLLTLWLAENPAGLFAAAWADKGTDGRPLR